MDVLETTLQCTRKTVSSALMTVTCLTASVASVDKLQGIDIQSPSLQSTDGQALPSTDSSHEGQDIEEAITVLQEQLKLYRARTLYVQGEASRLLTLDWVSYRRYISEARRYKQMCIDTQKKIEELQQLLK